MQLVLEYREQDDVYDGQVALYDGERGVFTPFHLDLRGMLRIYAEHARKHPEAELLFCIDGGDVLGWTPQDAEGLRSRPEETINGLCAPRNITIDTRKAT